MSQWQVTNPAAQAALVDASPDRLTEQRQPADRAATGGRTGERSGRAPHRELGFLHLSATICSSAQRRRRRTASHGDVRR
jgi:hypothetical protein